MFFLIIFSILKKYLLIPTTKHSLSIRLFLSSTFVVIALLECMLGIHYYITFLPTISSMIKYLNVPLVSLLWYLSAVGNAFFSQFFRNIPEVLYNPSLTYFIHGARRKRESIPFSLDHWTLLYLFSILLLLLSGNYLLHPQSSLFDFFLCDPAVSLVSSVPLSTLTP